MSAELKRVEPLYEQFYKILKNKILNIELKPKDRLIDTQLAAEFGTSRSPIREALRMLEQDGLLDNNRGIITVYEPSLKDVIELYKVRSGLEYSAVYWATENHNQDFIAKLDKNIILTQTAFRENNYEKVVQLNTEFHDLILYNSENGRLIDMMEKIRSLILLYRNILFLDFDMSNDYFLHDHLRVAEFIKQKDLKRAAEAMVDHIINDIENYKRVFQKKRRVDL